MRFRLTMAGGIAGLRQPPQLVDTQNLSPQVAETAQRLLEAARTAPPVGKPSSRMRDGLAYSITVEDSDTPIVLRGSDGSMTPEFAALLDWLRGQTR